VQCASPPYIHFGITLRDVNAEDKNQETLAWHRGSRPAEYWMRRTNKYNGTLQKPKVNVHENGDCGIESSWHRHQDWVSGGRCLGAAPYTFLIVGLGGGSGLVDVYTIQDVPK